MYREDVVAIVQITILLIVFGFITGYQYFWPNPLYEPVPVTWYWTFGNVMSILFIAPSSIGIYILLLLWFINVYIKAGKDEKSKLRGS